MGTTQTWNERTLFNGAKNIIGSLELDGFLNIDNSPGSEKSSATPADWTAGTNWAFAGTVCTHTAGATATLSLDASEVANEIYRVVFPVAARTAGSVTVSIGGVSGTARSSNATFTEYITATGTGNLTFTPSSDFDGNVDIASVSVKRVGVAAADRVTAWVGGRIASGVEQAGKGSLYLIAEDGTQHVLGDQVIFNAASSISSNIVEIHTTSSNTGLALLGWLAGIADPTLDFYHSRSATRGGHTVLQSGDRVGHLVFWGSDGSAFIQLAQIHGVVDGTPGLNDMPGRLVFFTTADGSTNPTERLRIDSAGDFTFADGGDFIFGSTTGHKLGTATTQKLGFWNATPVVQGAAVADASGGATIDAEARTAINTLLARMRTYGLIAT